MYYFFSNLLFYLSISQISRKLLTYPKHSKSTFIDDGFQNLKKGLKRFREHETSVMHKKAIFKLAAMESLSEIGTLLSRQLERDKALHHKMLMKVLSCVKYLARLCLPRRGHYEGAASFQGICINFFYFMPMNHQI